MTPHNNALPIIQVANVARRFPQVLAALAEGRISLSVAGRLAPHLREENVEKLLSDCAGMTKHAVEEYLVRVNPQPIFESSIRKLPTAAKRTTSRAKREDLTSDRRSRRAQVLRPGRAARRFVNRLPCLHLLLPLRLAPSPLGLS